MEGLGERPAKKSIVCSSFGTAKNLYGPSDFLTGAAYGMSGLTVPSGGTIKGMCSVLFAAPVTHTGILRATSPTEILPRPRELDRRNSLGGRTHPLGSDLALGPVSQQVSNVIVKRKKGCCAIQ